EPFEQPQAPEIKSARALIAKAEGFFEQASAEDKEDMVDLIETITECIESGDIEGLTEPVEQLNDILYYLES
ncbi:MAG: Hsp70 family protein, partial [Gammaproteobacteria bacterium]